MAWLIFGVVKKDAGESLIEEWIRDAGVKCEVGLDTQLRYLVNTPIVEWHRPQAHPLGDGIYEIRFKAENVQQRPLGFFIKGTNQFCIVLFATEKGGKFIPKDAIDRAKKIRNKIESGQFAIKEYKGYAI